MPTLTFARAGKLTIEWFAGDNMRLTREDNMQAVELSISEWTLIVQIASLHGWPVCPPLKQEE